MMEKSADEVYAERVKAAAAEYGVTSLEHLPDPQKTQTGRPVASWFNGSIQELHDLDQVLTYAEEDGQALRRAVCVIENINWYWLCRIGMAWNLEPFFFANHGVSPTSDDVWSTLFPKHSELPTDSSPSKYKFVDGVFEHHYLAKDPRGMDELRRGLSHSSYHRRSWNPMSPYSPSCCTRVSYARVNANLYLFLVDPPLVATPADVQTLNEKTAASIQDRKKTTLRVQCSSVGAGITLPQLLKRKKYSLRQTLHSVFRHSWHLHVLFDQAQVQDLAINVGELFHLISASLHQTNLAAINKEVKSISFHELRKPNMATNTKLLNLREAISELDCSVSDTSKYVPSHVRLFYETLYSKQPGFKDYLNFQSPIERLASVRQEAADLERFLIDSFQLLMSSLSVLETQIGAEQARISIEQAARTARLTQLAFIYVPLSFVTSIFGMNVREINEAVLPIWVCFVTLVVVTAGTAALFGGYKLLNLTTKKQGGDDCGTKGDLTLSRSSSGSQV